jgi:hypothetical protein
VERFPTHTGACAALALVAREAKEVLSAAFKLARSRSECRVASCSWKTGDGEVAVTSGRRLEIVWTIGRPAAVRTTIHLPQYRLVPSARSSLAMLVAEEEDHLINAVALHAALDGLCVDVDVHELLACSRARQTACSPERSPGALASSGAADARRCT